MNRSYMYANGNIHVFDENNNKKIIEYTDNFLDKLLLENSLESIESLILSNDETIETIENLIKDRKNIIVRNTLLCTCIGYNFPNLVNNLKFNTMNDIKFISAMVFFSFGISIYIPLYNDFKKLYDDLNGCVYVRKKLVDEYNLKKEIYNELLEKKSNLFEEEYRYNKFNVFELDCSVQQRKLQALFNAAYYYGVNTIKVKKMFNKGTLENDLQFDLLHSEIDKLKEFLEEENKVKLLKK